MERETTSGCARTILLADNKAGFLETCREHLELSGFHVLTAGDSAQARQILQQRYVHLAVLDKRLERDEDKLDVSGIDLAASVAPTVPKVILTRFADADHAADAMRQNAAKLRPAVDFIDKNKMRDFSQLVAAIRQAFDTHVELNWDLVIYRRPELSLEQIAARLGKGLPPASFAERLCELGDLFRRLFQDEEQITIDEIVLSGSGYVLLKVFSFDGVNLDQYIVSCGRSTHIKREEALYHAAVPRLSAYPGLRFDRSALSIHFGALAYHVHGGDLEDTMPLGTILWRGESETALEKLDILFSRQLAGWHEKGSRVNQDAGLTDFYTQHRPPDWPEMLGHHVQGISGQILSAGIGRCDHLGHTLRFYPEPMQPVNYPNPATFWTGERFRLHGTVVWGQTHGNVQAANVLVGKADAAWLIDFSTACKAPLIHDYVTLEADLKRWAASNSSLARWHALETRLLAEDSWPDVLDDEGLGAADAMLLRLIGRVRLWAARQTGCSAYAYLTALYYITIGQIEEFQSDLQRYPSHRLRPYAQSVLSAAMICARLQPADASAAMLPETAQSSFWLDTQNKQAWVEGRQVQLTPQEFDLLNYLYKRPGRLCTREELYQEVLGIEFDRYDKYQYVLNSAMSRLRKKIEPNPNKPRYIETVRGQGYKLHAPDGERTHT